MYRCSLENKYPDLEMLAMLFFLKKKKKKKKKLYLLIYWPCWVCAALWAFR